VTGILTITQDLEFCSNQSLLMLLTPPPIGKRYLD